MEAHGPDCWREPLGVQPLGPRAQDRGSGKDGAGKPCALPQSRAAAGSGAFSIFPVQKEACGVPWWLLFLVPNAGRNLRAGNKEDGPT